MPGPAEEDPDLRLQALLADLRHTAPVPDDVVARLDTALAGLREEEPVAAAPRHRDRHWGRRLVLAAAGVAAVALVATPFVRQAADTSSDSSTVAGAAADSGASKAEGRQPLAAQPSVTPGTVPETGGLVELRSASFGRDVEQQYDALSSTATRDTGATVCSGPTPSGDVLLSRTVLLDGAPARLDVVQGTGDSARALAYSCDGATVVSRARIAEPAVGNSPGPPPQE